MRKGMVIFLTLFFLAACTMPETKIYSLYIPIEKRSINFNADISIAIVLDAPRYLAQPYIIHRNSPYQLAISKYSKWDAPPSEILKEALKDSLASTGMFKEVRTSNVIPSGFYSLKIYLKKFELLDVADGPFGELEFDVSLLSHDGKEQYRSTISKKMKLDDKTFLSLAKGLSSALSDGIEEVKINIVKALNKS